MRTQIQRSRKYGAKLSGDVLHRRITADGDRQKAAYRTVVGDQVGVERLTKRILEENGVMVGLVHYYMNFAKKIYQDKGMYSGGTLITEVCAEYEHWSLRGLSTAVMDEIIARMGLSSCAAAPALCDWDWKRKLTFSGNVSATNLDDFPVLVHLTVANFDFAKAQNLGQDIRFMDSDTCPSDGTPLDHEIEEWDQAGSNAWVWVKVPRIDGGSVIDFIYMFYGNAVAPDGQDVNGVWSSSFETVLHMHLTAGMVNDSTDEGNHFTNNGTLEVAGKISQCLDFERNDVDFIEHANPSGYTWTNGYGFSCWVELETAGFVQYICDKRNGVDEFYIYVAPSHDVVGGVFTIAGGQEVTGAAAPVNVGWHYIYHVKTPTHHKIYIDGVEKGSLANANVMVNGSAPLTIGARYTHAQSYDGLMDEVRVSSLTRSPDWVMAQWKAQDETLITYGAEAPGG